MTHPQTAYAPMSPRPRKPRRRWVWVLLLAAIGIGAYALRPHHTTPVAEEAKATPALTVTAASVVRAEWAEVANATGAIAPWQEAIIGSEISGQRLVELRVNVGDIVKKGDVLARYNTDTLRAEQAELNAQWQKADADRKRAASLKGSGVLSVQQVESYNAQAAITRAQLDAKNLQLRYATIVAPEDGVISARTATLGAIGSAGGELFRLIVKSRLEWRGELTAEQLVTIKRGAAVQLALPDGSAAKATIRQIAPALGTESRMALAYADITAGSHARAGMYANGSIVMAKRSTLTVPTMSVVIRDGRSYVFVLATTTDATSKIMAQVVTTGRQQDGQIEILAGLDENARVVAQGAGFLNDGDTVRVVESAPVAGEAK